MEFFENIVYVVVTRVILILFIFIPVVKYEKWSQQQGLFSFLNSWQCFNWIRFFISYAFFYAAAVIMREQHFYTFWNKLEERQYGLLQGVTLSWALAWYVLVIVAFVCKTITRFNKEYL